MAENEGTGCSDRPNCRGHRRFVGGFLDGHIDHMWGVHPDDFPLTIGYPNGSLYERDMDGGTEATYRLATDNDHFSRRARRRASGGS